MHIPMINEYPSNFEHLRTSDQSFPPFLLCMFLSFIFPSVSDFEIHLQ